ncbi:Uncharacterised protein [uncultured archaeon]|nr:Uncharacterised protein [uncultured archaeon]
MTSAEFELLLARKRQADRQAYFQAGIVAAAVINYSLARGEDHKLMDPWDFVPGGNPNAEDEKVDLTKMSPEEQAAYVKGIFSKAIYRKN